MLSEQIEILNASKNPELAHIVNIDPKMAQNEIDEKWWEDVSHIAHRGRERDEHWIWKNIVLEFQNPILHECLAIISKDGYVEGAMICRYDGASKIEPHGKSIYIEYLATAPKNRLNLVPDPPVRGVGTALIYWAVKQSYALGFDGCITLASLPRKQTLDFYMSKGFVRTSVLDPKTNLIDHELTKSAALEWLRKEGDLI